MTSRTLTIALAAAACALSLGSARAANTDPARQRVWNITDTCQKEAYQKFPDQNKDGEEKRRKYVRTCVVNHNIGSSQPMIMHQ